MEIGALGNVKSGVYLSVHLMSSYLKAENTPEYPGKESQRWILFFCICGMTLNFIAYYPGFLSPDSLDQYGQAITGKFSDWHPPAMAMLWSILCHIYQGPQLMLLLQLFFLWLSGYLLLRTVSSKIWRICIIIFLLSPFVQNFSGYIIKDSQMAFSWLLATAIIFYYSMQEKRPGNTAQLIGALLIAYGSWVRPNAAAGCLPLCLFWAYCMLGKQTRLPMVVWSFGLFLFIIIGQFILIPLIAKPAKQHPEVKLQMHDLSGIFVKTHTNVFPSALFRPPGLDTAYIRKKYHPATFDNIWWNNDNVAIAITDSQVAPIGSAWRDALRNFPRIYIQNRWEGFLYYLRLKNRDAPLTNYFVWIDENNPYHLSYKRNIISNGFIAPIILQQNMPYMRPWFWMLLNIVLFLFVATIPKGPMRSYNITLLTSGLLYQLPSIFIFQTDTDFRYFYWNCIACSVALALLIVTKTVKKTTNLQGYRP